MQKSLPLSGDARVGVLQRLRFQLPQTSKRKQTLEPCRAQYTPKGTESLPMPSRRSVLGGLGVLIAIPRGARANAETPYDEQSRIRLGLIEGRIQQCPLGQPNCVSTSSLTDTYGSPWEAPNGLSVSQVAKDLTAAVLAQDPTSGRLVASEELPNGGQYLLFELAGRFGLDNLEFLIKREESWNPADGLQTVVLYRSLARDIKYVYPFQTPVSDLGVQKARLGKIKSSLGWRVTGCELLECYEDYPSY